MDDGHTYNFDELPHVAALCKANFYLLKQDTCLLIGSAVTVAIEMETNGHGNGLDEIHTTDAATPDDETNMDDDLPVVREEDAEQVIILDQQDRKDVVDEDGEVLDNDSSMQAVDSDVTEKDEMEDVVDNALFVLRKHSSETVAIDSNPTDLNLIASGGCDDRAILWDIEKRTDLVELDGQGESVSTVAFSHDGKFLAIGSENGAISIMFLQGAQAPQSVLDGPSDAISFLSWHPRGPVLLAGSNDKTAYMWNASKGLFMMAFAGHEDAITSGFFSGDGKKVVTASSDSSIRVWNPTTGTTLVRIQANQPGIGNTFHAADIHCLAMGFPDTQLSMIVASGCAAGAVYVSNIETGQVLARLPDHGDGVETLAFSPSTFRPLLLASAGGDGTIRVRDMEAGAERCSFSHSHIVTKVKWHPSEPVLISSNSEGTICVWNALTGEKKTEFTGHRDFVTDFCFTGGGQFIASTSGDSTVRVFDLRPFLK